MNKKTLSLVGMIVGCVFVLVGLLALGGALGGNTSYPGSAPYQYDSGYASFGADYYTYSVNNSAEAASAARTAAGNLGDIADFLKVFCGLFSICFGAVIVCSFGIYRAGLQEAEISAIPKGEAVKAEETAPEDVAVEEIATEEVVTEEVIAEVTEETSEAE